MGRLLIALAACLMLTRCAAPPASSPVPSFEALNPTPPVVVVQPEINGITPVESGETEPPSLTTHDGAAIAFAGIAFHERSHRLVVVDQASGPGSTFPDAQAAAASINGLAAVNGGFFTPDGEPLGLVVSNRKASGAWNSASALGTGVFCEESGGHMKLVRRGSLTQTQARGMRELLQSGPMLIDNRQPVNGLDDDKSRCRTILLWDGRHRWWIGQSTVCTLDQLATALHTKPPVGWKVQMALNLDGGTSCDLWISNKIPGGSITRKPFFSKPARNYLVLVSR